MSKRPRLPPSRPPHHPNASSPNLRTLTDLLGAATSRADSALGDSAPQDAWSSIVKTVDGLTSSVHQQQPPTDIPPSDLAPDHSPSAYNFQNLSKLPIDLSLKTRLRISSHLSLFWTRLCSQRDVYCAIDDVVSGRDPLMTSSTPTIHNSPANETSDTSRPIHSQPTSFLQQAIVDPNLLKGAYSLFNRRLIHFRFPSNPQASSLATSWQTIFLSTRVPTRDDANSNILRQEAQQRLSLWQTALQSVYYGYRYQRVPSFYVILSNAIVIFHRTLDEARTPIALLSPASPGLRSLLSDYIVSFTINRIDENDTSDQVFVNVRGELDVHMLYNFIMGTSHKLSGAIDVPTLVCDRPFIGGTAMMANIENARAARSDSNPGDGPATKFNVQIRGFLTPRQFEGICQALSIIQQSNFRAIVETESKSIGLNNLLMTSAADQEGKDDQGISEQKGATVTSVAAFPAKSGLFVNVRNPTSTLKIQ